MSTVEIIECPRDAMQGIKPWIPTEKKLRYAQSLLKVGFNCLDIGSFVSPKAIPQMRDTAAVLDGLDRSQSETELLCVVANLRGAEMACQHSTVDWLGYPFSISENFQMRNTHKTIADSEILLDEIIALCQRYNKKLVVYLSMGFGNPYGDPWSTEIIGKWMALMGNKGVKTISLSDTIGVATPAIITEVFSQLLPAYPQMRIGAHFHTTPSTAFDKISAAYAAGCRRFDGAIGGYGGCPMAKSELVGNMPTEKLLTYFAANNISHALHPLHFEAAYNVCLQTMGKY